MKNINTRVTWIRLCFLTAAFVAVFSAKATNRLYIPDFTVSTYDPVTVPVMLDNSDEVAAASFTITLPEELELVSMPVKNEDRFANKQTLSSNQLANGDIKVTIASFQRLPFIGNHGEIASFEVKAKNGVLGAASSTVIKVSEVALALGNGTAVDAPRDLKTNVALIPGTFALTVPEAGYSVAPAERFTLSLGLENTIPVKGMQFAVMLPEGFTADENSFLLTNRCLSDAIPVVNVIGKQMNVQIVTVGGENVIPQAGKGNILTFELNTPAEFTAETAEVLFTNTTLSIACNIPVYVKDASSVIRNTAPTYNAALALVGQLREALSTALSVIASDCPDVKDQYDGQQISQEIDAFASDIESANTDKTLIDNYSKYAERAQAIEAQIAQLIADAQAAQTGELDRRQANQNAYDSAKAKIDAIKAEYDKVVAEIKAEYPDFVDEAEEQAVADAINQAYTDAADALAAVANAGTYSYNVDETGLNAQITAMLTNARDRKAAADAEKETARQAANKTAYDADMATIDQLFESYRAMVAKINAEYPEYRDAVQENDVRNDLDAAKTAVENAYKAVAEAGVYSSPLDVNALQAEIDALYEDAIARKAEADKAETERQEANYAAYTADIDIINGLNTKYSEALATIEENYPTYLDKEASADILASINSLWKAVDAAYAAVDEKGTYVSPISSADVKLIEQAISALIADAKAKFDAETARQEANYMSFEADSDTWNALLNKYNETLDKIETEFPGSLNQEEADGILAAINALWKEIEDAYAAVDESGEYKSPLTEADLADLETRIQKLYDDAKYVALVPGLSVEEMENAEYYTLDGTKHDRPVKGQINIIRCGEKQVKLMVK